MTIPLKYQLQEKLIKQIRDDERRKCIEEVEKMISQTYNDNFIWYLEQNYQSDNPDWNRLLDSLLKNIMGNQKELKQKLEEMKKQ